MKKTPPHVLHGIPASPGANHGPAFIHDPKRAPAERRSIPPGEIEGEIDRFNKAVEEARAQLRETRNMVSAKIDQAHAAIFDAQEVLLDDPLLTDACRREIRAQKLNAEYILEQTVEEIRRLFAQIDVKHFSVQNLDVLDVAARIRESLSPKPRSRLERIARNSIIVAHDLRPSDTAHLNRRHVMGIITEAGGPTSHFAILAKALNIPAVVGVEDILRHVRPGDDVIVDGFSGAVTVHPSPGNLERVRQRRLRMKADEESLQKLRDLPCETQDGYRIDLAANLELPSEVEAIRQSGAQGIGLFRSEFFYIDRGYIPPEEEQFQAYREVLEKMAPMPVICRTLDLGGDKFVSQQGVVTGDMNPFLGLRAIRLCLANPDMFRSQLRAILRASAFGNAKIMFPFITDVSEVRRAMVLLDQTRDDLRRDGIAYDPDAQVGIMIETPSAALTAETLAEEVDFFSLGTNDLIQYALAVDRANESVADLYNPLHPAVLHLITRTIDAAHRAGIWVGLCGEMAADPALAALLLGLGIDELSMSCMAIPEVKRLIRSLTLDEIHQFRQDVLTSLGTEKTPAVLSRFRRKCAKRRVA